MLAQMHSMHKCCSGRASERRVSGSTLCLQIPSAVLSLTSECFSPLSRCFTWYGSALVLLHFFVCSVWNLGLGSSPVNTFCTKAGVLELFRALRFLLLVFFFAYIRMYVRVCMPRHTASASACFSLYVLDLFSLHPRIVWGTKHCININIKLWYLYLCIAEHFLTLVSIYFFF